MEGGVQMGEVAERARGSWTAAWCWSAGQGGALAFLGAGGVYTDTHMPLHSPMKLALSPHLSLALMLRLPLLLSLSLSAMLNQHQHRR